ncbi:MAG: RluA family pseudouridine synthase [Stellaceae bacterium]
MTDQRIITATTTLARERLDRVLARALAPLSRAQVKRLIEGGAVAAGGLVLTDPAAKVKSGQEFVITLPASVPDKPAPQPMALVIPYEDEHLLVIDKPAGLVVHPAPGNPDRTLVNALIAHCGDSLAGIGGVRRPGIVHRLDKDTSGLMVAAKTDAAHRQLSADFAARRIERAYRAIVWGVPPAEGEIVGAIGRNPRDRKKMAVVAKGGKPAVTRYRRVVSYSVAAALLECRLATGRTHQIRVHLASIGHPLIGDPTYGHRHGARRDPVSRDAAAYIATFHRQALHAVLLGFRHPATGIALRFTSDLPDDILALDRLLRAA